MATLDHASLLRAAYDAWNAKDLARMATYAQPDARMTNVPFGDVLDFRTYAQNWATAFPDGRIEIVNLVSQGDYVVCEFIGRGTHAGALMGPTGAIPASHRKVEVRMVEIWECRNGKLAAGRSYFDSRTLMSQLGLMPQIGAQPGAEPRASHPSQA